jgi:hypothetical protein
LPSPSPTDAPAADLARPAADLAARGNRPLSSLF